MRTRPTRPLDPPIDVLKYKGVGNKGGRTTTTKRGALLPPTGRAGKRSICCAGEACSSAAYIWTMTRTRLRRKESPLRSRRWSISSMFRTRPRRRMTTIRILILPAPNSTWRRRGRAHLTFSVRFLVRQTMTGAAPRASILTWRWLAYRTSRLAHSNPSTLRSSPLITSCALPGDKRRRSQPLIDSRRLPHLSQQLISLSRLPETSLRTCSHLGKRKVSFWQCRASYSLTNSFTGFSLIGHLDLDSELDLDLDLNQDAPAFPRAAVSAPVATSSRSALSAPITKHRHSTHPSRFFFSRRRAMCKWSGSHVQKMRR